MVNGGVLPTGHDFGDGRAQQRAVLPAHQYFSAGHEVRPANPHQAGEDHTSSYALFHVIDRKMSALP